MQRCSVTNVTYENSIFFYRQVAQPYMLTAASEGWVVRRGRRRRVRTADHGALSRATPRAVAVGQDGGAPAGLLRTCAPSASLQEAFAAKTSSARRSTGCRCPRAHHKEVVFGRGSPTNCGFQAMVSACAKHTLRVHARRACFKLVLRAARTCFAKHMLPASPLRRCFALRVRAARFAAHRRFPQEFGATRGFLVRVVREVPQLA